MTKQEPLPEAAIEILRQFMEEHIPFNRFLGMKLRSASRGHVAAELPFREELVGDPFKPALHGGVMSAFADAVGGCAVFTVIEAGSRCSTIDLRIDYLRPGKLEALAAEAEVLRVGGRVVVTRTDIFQGDRSAPIAVVMGVYSIKRGG